MKVQGRIRWEVAPVRGSLLWSVTRDGVPQCTRLFKYRAVEFARLQCQDELDTWDLRSELMVKNRRGQYTREGSTFGADPRHIEG